MSKYDLARKAIIALFNDTSVDQSITKDQLESLIEEIQSMIESLEV